MSINMVAISGNLTRDAELRTTAGGTQVLNIGVAVNERRKNPQTGDWEDVPQFVDCTMFGNRAEKIAPYLTKGAKVSIQGRLHYSAWKDRNTGQNRSKLDVTVSEIEFLSRNQAQQQPQQQNYPQARQNPATPAYSAPQGNYAQQPQPTYAQQQVQTGYQPQAAGAYSDEDIPF